MKDLFERLGLEEGWSIDEQSPKNNRTECYPLHTMLLYQDKPEYSKEERLAYFLGVGTPVGLDMLVQLYENQALIPKSWGEGMITTREFWGGTYAYLLCVAVDPENNKCLLGLRVQTNSETFNVCKHYLKYPFKDEIGCYVGEYAKIIELPEDEKKAMVDMGAPSGYSI